MHVILCSFMIYFVVNYFRSAVTDDTDSWLCRFMVMRVLDDVSSGDRVLETRPKARFPAQYLQCYQYVLTEGRVKIALWRGLNIICRIIHSKSKGPSLKLRS